MPDVTEFIPDAQNTRALRDAFGTFATGVTIVTVASDAGPVAITASSFAPVSLDPPLVLWSPQRSANRYRYFEAAADYAIHVLAADQAGLCWQVAKDAYALRDRELALNEEGVPVLQGCLARFDCTRHAVHDGGDHAIILGRVNRVEMRGEGDGLAFFRGASGAFAAP